MSHFIPSKRSEILWGSSKNTKVSNDLLETIGITYEDLILKKFEDLGKSYSCIIWTKDIDMTLAVEIGIDAAEKTRTTYREDAHYDYP